MDFKIITGGTNINSTTFFILCLQVSEGNLWNLRVLLHKSGVRSRFFYWSVILLINHFIPKGGLSFQLKSFKKLVFRTLDKNSGQLCSSTLVALLLLLRIRAPCSSLLFWSPSLSLLLDQFAIFECSFIFHFNFFNQFNQFKCSVHLHPSVVLVANVLLHVHA